MKQVLIMAGGTGGHIFPALAVAQQFVKQGWQVQWLGAQVGLENSLIAETEYPLHRLQITGFVNKNRWQKVAYLWQLCKAILQARKIIRQIKPDLVLGFGGFPSAPGGVAAKLCSVPLVIHEQNAVAGMTNRYLAKLADAVLLGFPGAIAHKKQSLWVGNPIRSQLNSVKWTACAEKINILVLGGSLGAKGINLLMPEVMRLLDNQSLSLVHQVGKGNKASVLKLYQQASQSSLRVVEFIDDMAEVYRQADLDICRSGASTVSELTNIGMPAFYIPYPYHKDQQQMKNTASVVEAGGAKVFAQFTTSAQQLADEITKIINQRSKLQSMSDNTLKCAKHQSAQLIVEHCLQVIA